METKTQSTGFWPGWFLFKSANAISYPHVVRDLNSLQNIASAVVGRREAVTFETIGKYGFKKITPTIWGAHRISFSPGTIEICGYFDLDAYSPTASFGIKRDKDEWPDHFVAILSESGGLLWYIWGDKNELPDYKVTLEGKREEVKIVKAPSKHEMALAFNDGKPVTFSAKGKNSEDHGPKFLVTLDNIMYRGDEQIGFSGLYREEYNHGIFRQTVRYVAGEFSHKTRRGTVINAELT